jgi:hypothetical protein
MSEKPISALRRCMIEDMSVRNFVRRHATTYPAREAFTSMAASPTLVARLDRRGAASS